MRNSISRIAGLSFACSLLFYVFLNDHILVGFSTNPPLVRVVVEVLAAIGFYSILFGGLCWLYTRYFYRIFDRRLDMDGDWYQIFVVSQYPVPAEAIRHGSCRITSSYEDVSISGENHRVGGEFSSTWQSEISTVTRDKLILMYVSEGVRRGSNYITRGTMSYRIYGSPPSKLVGTFSDSTPATHSGPITLFKVKKEYERELAALTASAVEVADTQLLEQRLRDDQHAST